MRKEDKRQGTRKDQQLEKAASKISGLIIKVQTKWAEWMSAVFEKLGARGSKAMTVIFIGFFSFMSGFIIVRSFTTKEAERIRPMMIRSPSVKLQSDSLLPRNESDERLVSKALDQLKTMDSLGLEIREGLRDSIEELKRLYLKPKNMK